MIQKYEIHVREHLDSLRVIKRYFGLAPSDLNEALKLVEKDADSDPTWSFYLMVQRGEIESLFSSFFKGNDDIRPYVIVLWLVANIYYGSLYDYYMIRKQVEQVEDSIHGEKYLNIREDALELFLALRRRDQNLTAALKEKQMWEESWMRQIDDRNNRFKSEFQRLKSIYGPSNGDNDRENRLVEIAWDNVNRQLDIEMKNDPEYRSVESIMKDTCPITIKINVGRKKIITLKNAHVWLPDLLENHLFPHFIPDILSRQDAQQERRSISGADIKDPIRKILVLGIGNYLRESQVVMQKAPHNLIRFIRRILETMRLLSCDSLEEVQTAEKAIKHDLEDTLKENPKFYNPESNVAIGFYDMNEHKVNGEFNVQEVEAALDWLHPTER